MDIIKFVYPSNPTYLEKHPYLVEAEIINKLKSKTWIERYRGLGEFRLVGNYPEETREALPIGSLISHTKTDCVMMVEDHQIIDKRDAPPEIIITGRSIDFLIGDRVRYTYTYDYDWGASQLPKLTPITDVAANVAYYLVHQAFYYRSTIPNEYIQALLVDEVLSGSGGPTYRQPGLREEIIKSVSELLDLGDLGIKIIRPGPRATYFGTSGTSRFRTTVRIHDGVSHLNDEEPMFSYSAGEIKNAEYLWSNKGFKNGAYVVGVWLDVYVDGPSEGLENRYLLVDAKDIDEGYSSAPTGSTKTNLENEMVARGQNAISQKQSVELLNVEISDDITSKQYRKDFDIGDYIKIQGKYGVSANMRIVEYVEIEDENGEVGYPMLKPYVAV